jgi:hypothetical protein
MPGAAALSVAAVNLNGHWRYKRLWRSISLLIWLSEIGLRR